MVVECVVHLRRSDLEWFHRHNNHQVQEDKNGDDDDNNNEMEKERNPLFDEIMDLLQTSILPRNFSHEIENVNGKKIPELGPGGIEVTSGEKNHDQQQRKAAGGNKGRKRKRLTKKQLADLEREKEKLEQRKNKDIYYALGRQVKLAYRLQEHEPKGKPAVTLLYNNSNDNDARKEEEKKFRSLTKLSKKILIWCYPSSMDDDDMDTGSLVRPDFIPMADLFHRSRDGNPNRDGKL